MTRSLTDVHVQFISPETLKSSNVTWSDANVWITSHTVPLFNIWYYSARLMALYRARRLNAAGALGLELPTISPDDVLYIPSPANYHTHSTWEREFTQVWHGAIGRCCRQPVNCLTPVATVAVPHTTGRPWCRRRAAGVQGLQLDEGVREFNEPVLHQAHYRAGVVCLCGTRCVWAANPAALLPCSL